MAKTYRKMRKSRRNRRTRKAGMYNVAERERLRKLKDSIPLSVSVKMRTMSHKEKMKAFKKMGIKKKDVIAMRKLMEDENVEKRALEAHRKMMGKANRHDKDGMKVSEAIPIVSAHPSEPMVPPLPSTGGASRRRRRKSRRRRRRSRRRSRRRR